MSDPHQVGRLAMLKNVAELAPMGDYVAVEVGADWAEPDAWTFEGGTWSHSDGRTFASWWRGQWRDEADATWFGAPDGHPDSFERVL